MTLVVVILLILLVLGGGGYRLGGPDNGPLYAGSGIGLVLLILLILFVTGYLGPIGRLR